MTGAKPSGIAVTSGSSIAGSVAFEVRPPVAAFGTDSVRTLSTLYPR